MSLRYLKCNILILLIPILFLIGSSEPNNEQLVSFYSDKLDHEFILTRVDGIAGLAHLENGITQPVSKLLELSKSDQSFEQLISSWVLAKISAGQYIERLNGQVSIEYDKLLEGTDAVFAARTAFLAVLEDEIASNQELNRSLPKLYNMARGSDTGSQLLAAWSLNAMGTKVTRETAAHGLEQAAASLDPDHGNYTRHLLYIRINGSTARPFFSDKLESIINEYDFGSDPFSKKAQTIYTLAAIQYPSKPKVLNEYRESLAKRLQNVLYHDIAVSDLLAAGPYACSDFITKTLETALLKIDDPDEREDIERALKMCNP